MSRKGREPSTMTSPSLGPVEFLAKAGDRCREIADKFFNDVFHGQKAEYLAVFVDDEADALAVFLEECQLRKYWCSRGNVIRCLQLLQQCRLVEILVAQAG
jgi:hypothetical protein